MFRHLSFAKMGVGGISLLIVAIIIVCSRVAEGACTNGTCQVHDVCNADSDCSAGLKCISCSSVGDMSSRCTRVSTTDPVSKLGGDLPFNRYSWLTSHNSFAIIGAKELTGSRLTFSNQEDSVTDQLKSGVRGLMLDMYDFQNEVWMCHSIGGKCNNFTSFNPAIDTLREIQSFMASNPSAIITIIIEDYVQAKKGLTNVFTQAGLMKYMYPLSDMPKNGSDWPTVSQMIAKNHRLLVFTSKKSKEQSEGIAYQWNYMVENQYGDAGLQTTSCTNREESPPLTSKTQSLVLENFFPDNPSKPKACVNNSDPLLKVLDVCKEASGGRWANFLAVDFYKRSYGGGAFQAVDRLNGELLCGCTDISLCQGNSTFGKCKSLPSPSKTTDSSTSGASNTPSDSSSSSSMVVGLKSGAMHLAWLLLLLVLG